MSQNNTNNNNTKHIQLQDLKKVMNTDGLFVLAESSGDLGTVQGFEEAIKLSLFSNSRLADSQVKNPFNRGGWVGNILDTNKQAIVGRELGGKTFQAEAAKATQDTLNKARDAAKKSLNWMIEDGICRDIQVQTVFIKQRDLQYTIDIVARDGVKYSYTYLWGRTGSFSNSIQGNF
jgi:phage gp46-like protein